MIDAGVTIPSLEIHSIVSEEVIRYAARESSANVVARGATETLRTVAANDASAFQTAFQNNEQARRQMLYLRAEGLIEFPFDQIHQGRLTALGRLAFLNIATDAERDREAQSREERCAEEFALGRLSPPPLEQIRSEDSLVFDVRTEQDRHSWVQFNLDQPGAYSVLVEPSQGRGDPYTYLFNASRSLIAEDDDGAHEETAWASRIVRQLGDGTYILGVRDIDREGSTFRVEITQQTDPASAADFQGELPADDSDVQASEEEAGD